MISWDEVNEIPSEYTSIHEPHDVHENKIAENLFFSIQNSTDPYAFILSYFGDVDARSHQHGALSERWKIF